MARPVVVSHPGLGAQVRLCPVGSGSVQMIVTKVWTNACLLPENALVEWEGSRVLTRLLTTEWSLNLKAACSTRFPWWSSMSRRSCQAVSRRGATSACQPYKVTPQHNASRLRNQETTLEQIEHHLPMVLCQEFPPPEHWSGTDTSRTPTSSDWSGPAPALWRC